MASQASQLVRAVLEEYGALAKTILRGYLKPGEPRRHLYDLVSEYPERGGRSLRASLCIAAVCAFGGQVKQALGPAIALEMLHNAFLIHDDIEDDSDERRGLPTMNALYGVPTAVNVGDALAIMSLRPLIDHQRVLGSHLTLRILRETERMARESVEGQAIELGWRRDNATALSTQDYLFMILKKTCWYTTIFPLRVGALVGGAPSATFERVVRFGFFLGAAFQIQDDLLNLVGEPEKYGKEIDGDLWEGKRTLILLHAMQRMPIAERQRVRALLDTPRAHKSALEVRWLREQLDEHGSLEFARRTAHGMAGAALHEAGALLDPLPATRDREFLRALPRWVLERA